MNMVLSPRASRALALTLLVCLLAVFYLAALQPLIDDWISTHTQIQELSALSSRYRALGDALPTLREQRNALQQQVAAASGLLAGTNETLAGADLQGRIRSAVEAAHGELKTTQILPIQPDGAFRRIGVRSEMTMTLPAVQQLLYALETGTPTLLLDKLSIRSHAANRQEDRNPDVVMLDVSVDVYGYLRAAP